MIYNFEWNKLIYQWKKILTMFLFIIIEILFLSSIYLIIKILIDEFQLTINQIPINIKLMILSSLVVANLIIIVFFRLINFAIESNYSSLTSKVTGLYNHWGESKFTLKDKYLSIFNENIENKIRYKDIKDIKAKGDILILILKNEEKFYLEKTQYSEEFLSKLQEKIKLFE